MTTDTISKWRRKITPIEKVLDRIQPGMNIFIGTGAAEPRTLLKHLMESDKGNLQDLDLIQLISLGYAVSIEERYSRKYRLKTFFSGWVASEAITAGKVDLIPCRLSYIGKLLESDAIPVDTAFVQITPFDGAGYASLGASVDVARLVMEKASLVVGEINERAPRTLGDTFVHVDDFDYLVHSEEPPMYFDRWPVDDVYDQVAENVASMVESGSCIGFTIGPLYEALGKHLSRKRDLGVHSPTFTDALMDLVKSGAVSNRKKGIFKGKCLASYAVGTEELMQWLHRNPLVEFQGIDVVANPGMIGLNDNYVSIYPARKVDLTGRIALHAGRGSVSASPGESFEFYIGASFSKNGKTIYALPSRNLERKSNILLSVEEYPNQFTVRESLDYIITEYGVASLKGRTIRERALLLIDIAHPDDREALVDQAKEANLLYPDQIYLTDSGRLYPKEIECSHTFSGDLVIRFRPIKPSDEDEMRKLFYRFSDESVYYRYFSRIKTMPHTKMQQYVNVDYRKAMSIVGLVGGPGSGRIIAEARYVRLDNSPIADVAMVVDDEFQRRGIATFIFQMLVRVAKERGVRGFVADVIPENKAIMKVLEKGPYPVKATMDYGTYHLNIPLTDNP